MAAEYKNPQDIFRNKSPVGVVLNNKIKVNSYAIKSKLNKTTAVKQEKLPASKVNL